MSLFPPLKNKTNIDLTGFNPFGLKTWFSKNIKTLDKKPDIRSVFPTKITSKRMSFYDIEKFLRYPAPNIENSIRDIGMTSLESFLTNDIHKLLSDELAYYNKIKNDVDNVVKLVSVVTNSTDLNQVISTYESFSKIKQLNGSKNRLTDRNPGVSIRDQLINHRANLQKYVNDSASARFTLNDPDSKNTLLQTEQETSNQIRVVDNLLSTYPVELEEMVADITDLPETVDSISRSRVENISSLLSNVKNRFVRAEFLKAHVAGFPSQAQNYKTDKLSPQDAIIQNMPTAVPPPKPGATENTAAEEAGIDQTKLVAFGSLTENQFDEFKNILSSLISERHGDTSKPTKVVYHTKWKFSVQDFINAGFVKPGSGSRELGFETSWNKDFVNRGVQISSLDDAEKKADDLLLLLCVIEYKKLLHLNIIKPESSAGNDAGVIGVSYIQGRQALKLTDSDGNLSYIGADGLKASDIYDKFKTAMNTPDEPDEDQQAENALLTNENDASDSMPISYPPTGGAPLYPHNEVREYEGGHVVEFDSTPGAERIAEHHTTGTGYEITPDGDHVTTIRGSKYTAIVGSDYIVVQGECAIIVEGDASVKADNVTVAAKSDLKLSAGGDLIIDAANMRTNVSGSSIENIRGDQAVSVGGFSSHSVDGDIAVDSGSLTQTCRDGSINLISSSGISLSSTNGINIKSGSSISVISSDNLSIAGSDIAIGATGFMSVSGAGSATFSSGGLVSIAGAGPIALSHPVQTAQYALSAGSAPPGPANVVNPTGSANSGAVSDTTNAQSSVGNETTEATEKSVVSFDTTGANGKATA